ncbi:MAG: DnaJ domain-containing protein [Bacteroidota bacterium]
MITIPKTYYEILTVQQDASFEDIKNAYCRGMLKVQQNRNGYSNIDSIFTRLRMAYDVLTDDNRRSLYDISLVTPESQKLADKNTDISDSAYDSIRNSFITSDPLEEAVTIDALSWRDFNQYPPLIKKEKIFTAIKFRIAYAIIGALIGIIITVLLNLHSSGYSNHRHWYVDIPPEMIEYYQLLVLCLAISFIIIGRPIVYFLMKRIFK